MLSIKKLKLPKAFTLVELLVVMVIITIIASFSIGAGSAARDKAARTKAKAMMASIEMALTMYYADVGTYPPEDDGGPGPNDTENVYDHLTNTDRGDDTHADYVPGWNGPYMNVKTDDLMGNSPEEIKDPWGNSYHYTYNASQNNPHPSGFDLWTNGALQSPAWWDVYKDLKNW